MTRLQPPSVYSPWLLPGTLAVIIGLSGCFPLPSFGDEVPICLRDQVQQSPTPSAETLTLPWAESPDDLELLRQSWLAYQQRFIQADGRVIDREAGDRTVSEGQAYAMLRAVLINDPATFVRTYTWAENNLRRIDDKGKPIDSLWAWKWGKLSNGEWKTIDANFASDADLDAATALILAARRWNCRSYLDEARVKLRDIWEHSTVEIDGQRYLIPGPKDVFWQQPDTLILNPSYLAPYAFRLFAEVDRRRDWMSLVDSSYDLLNESSAVSEVGLPADWIALNPETGEFRPLPPGGDLQSGYSFDAYRVWWRIALDATWYGEARAMDYLEAHLPYLETLWQNDRRIPARIGLDGEPQSEYEATSQYAMLHLAFRLVNPEIAEQIAQQKLMPQYQNGFWDSDSAYYTQNLAWFGLLSPDAPTDLLQATADGEPSSVAIAPTEPPAPSLSRSIRSHRARQR